MNQEPTILRHSVAERALHWMVALNFTFLFLSGLALFHPLFFWLSELFGGASFMRWLHPFTGLSLAALFFVYASPMVGDNRWLAADREWLKNVWAYMRKQHEPKGSHKYNAGQKLMYWSMVFIIAILLATGAALWQPWFAPFVSPELRRAAGLVHAISAFVMFVGTGVHIYAAFWTQGSIRAMVRGTVSRAWAEYHHPAWARELRGKSKGAP